MNELLFSEYLGLDRVQSFVAKCQRGEFGKWKAEKGKAGSIRDRRFKPISRNRMKRLKLPRFVNFMKLIGSWSRGDEANPARFPDVLLWDGRGVVFPNQERRISVVYGDPAGGEYLFRAVRSPDASAGQLGFELREAAPGASDRGKEIHALLSLDMPHELEISTDGKKYRPLLPGVPRESSKELFMSNGIDKAILDLDDEAFVPMVEDVLTTLSEAARQPMVRKVRYQLDIGNIFGDEGENVRSVAEEALANLPPAGLYDDDFQLSYRYQVPPQSWANREDDRSGGGEACDYLGTVVTSEEEELDVSVAYDPNGYSVILDRIPESFPLEIFDEVKFDH